MAIIIVDAPIEPFEYLSDNPLEMVLAWGLDTDALTNTLEFNGITNFGYLLNQLDFRVQVDSSTNFNTINLKEYTGSTASGFNKGINVFSMEVPVSKRNYDEDLTFYWRVRHELDGVSMSTLSDYCTYSDFSLNKNETIEITDELHLGLPDENVYTKDENSTNIYSILKNFGNQIDLSKFELKRVKDSIIDIDNVKESDLQNTFGLMLDFSKPDLMSFAEYRRMLKKLFDIYSHSGTVYSIREIVKILTGAYPLINEGNKTYGWIVYDTRAAFVAPPLPFDYLNSAAHFYPINDLDPETSNLVPKCQPMSRAEKAFRVNIRVKNPFFLELNRDLIAAAIYKLKPAHSKVYLTIENSQGIAEVYSYWDLAYSGTFYFSSEGV